MENTVVQEKLKPQSHFNPGLALIGLGTAAGTGLQMAIGKIGQLISLTEQLRCNL